MRKSIALVVVAVLFLLAWYAFPEHRPYAAGQVRVEIPNAAKAEAQKWEYLVVHQEPRQLIAVGGEKGLNAYGMDGWELCQAITSESTTTVILKRPLK
jgi:hypothetical protein